MNLKVNELIEKSKLDYDSLFGLDQLAIDDLIESVILECAKVAQDYAGGSMPIMISLAIKEHFGVK